MPHLPDKPQPPLISIRGLTKLYRMGDSVVRALDGVDLDIARGEFVAITGASGSGKSTMMHLLGCLDRPTAGSFVFEGRDVSNFSDRQLADVRNRSIGFVFQTFNLINRTSALDNVGVPLFYARKARIGEAARRALERVGLGHRSDHRPSELSGGERQRVAIARAIVNDPLLVLADEPTGNLDSRTGEQIMQVFHDLNAQGVTIILVTHEADVAIQARRIVHMKDGRIVSDRQVSDAERKAVRDLHESQKGAVAPSQDDHGGGDSPGAGRISAAAGESDEANRAVRGGAHGLGPSRTIRGATAALVCGILAPLIFAAAWIASVGVPKVPVQPGQVPPPTIAIRMGITTLAGLTGIVLAIVAIVIARSALKRLYDEPGAFHGAGRARTAIVLGCAVLITPVLLILRRMIT